MYPSVSRKILMLFKCMPVVPLEYMSFDTSLRCNNPVWIANAVFGVLSGVVYIIGVPLLFFTLIYRARYYQYRPSSSPKLRRAVPHIFLRSLM